MVRCPACGFDSPDSAQWCDFCKEPFRQARPPAANPEGVRKALEPGQGIPPEFLALDTGGKVPAAPRWLRYAAWSTLAAWLIVIMALMAAFMAKQRSSRTAQQPDQPSGRSAPSR